jgi:hypothetical protein
MAIVQIEAVTITTKSGRSARVTGIDMTSGDPFHGTVEVEPSVHRDARWRSNGYIRDDDPGPNVVMSSNSTI